MVYTDVEKNKLRIRLRYEPGRKMRRRDYNLHVVPPPDGRYPVG